MKGGMIAGHLKSMAPKLKPTLRINAYVDSYGGPAEPTESDKYLKEDAKRYKAEIAQIEKALDEWVPEDVAARAEKSLRLELKRKKAELIRVKAQLDALSEVEEEDEDEDED